MLPEGSGNGDEMTIQEEIRALKESRDAVILAHYYVEPEVQELADYVGDSFYLSKVASQTTADTLILCGVSFMGESAKIINPEKMVLMPDLKADCPMAHMADIEKIKEAGYNTITPVIITNSSEYLDVIETHENKVNKLDTLLKVFK